MCIEEKQNGVVREKSLWELSVNAKRKSTGTNCKFNKHIDEKVLFEKLQFFAVFEGHGQCSG